MARDGIKLPKGLKCVCDGGEGMRTKNTNFEVNDKLAKDNI